MTVLLILESVEFSSFGLCLGPEFHVHHGYVSLTLAEVFLNPQSVILKIFPHRLNQRNAIDNWT